MKKRNKRKRPLFLLFTTLFLAIFFALYSASNKMLIEIGTASYTGVLSTATYYSIEKTVDSGFEYSKLIKVDKDESGKITMITTDAYKFNDLTSKLADGVGYYLSKYISEGVEIPLGVFTGIRLIAGYGDKIKMPLIAINSVKCDVFSVFESAGINQTRHALYLEVTPDVAIVTRLSTKKVVDKIKVLLYDNLIVGEVPNVYMAGTLFSAHKVV